jgi:hypothetical protein
LASIGSADQNSLRAQAEAELAHVTVDIDRAKPCESSTHQRTFRTP